MAEKSSIQAKLATARRELLDISNRNRLISAPRSAGRSSRLEIVGESSDEVFRRLVVEQKSMSFLAAEKEPSTPPADEGEQEATSASLAQPDEDEAALTARQTDAHLQTPLSSEALQKRLLRLHYDARTFEEEQGVNILYLALGFLKWFEDANSTQERYAPLLLAPVKLTRSTAGTRFRLAWSQDEIVTNLSLQEKLRQEFHIELPDLPATDDLTPSQYFADVAKAVSAVRRWEVLPNDIVLWFFSFAKYLMYRDLDPQCWPEDRKLEGNSLVTSLLGDGFHSDPPLLDNQENIDRVLSPADLIHVVDADSSQAVVIELVRRGRNLVIQGPPGTGKSQAIANSIAAAVKDGKRVLFVAEKLAALEVVKRRLDNIGLGDICLELHSNKANKRAIIEEIGRVRSLRDETPRTDGILQQAEKLRQYRDRLNRHAEVLHSPLGVSGATAFEAVGELVRLRTVGAAARFQLPQASQWSRDEFERRRDLVSDLSQHLERLGPPQSHPWRGVTTAGLLPGDVRTILDKAPAIRQAVATLQAAAAALAKTLQTSPPKTPAAIAELARAAQHLLSAPPMDRAAMAEDVWKESRGEIGSLVEHGRDLHEISARLKGVVSDAAWRTELADVRRIFNAWGGSWFRWLSPKYRGAYRTLAGILQGPPPKNTNERLALIDDVQRGQAARLALESDSKGPNIGRRAFGAQWRGADSDWTALEAIARWEGEGRETKKLMVDFRQFMAADWTPEQVTVVVNDIKNNLKPMLQALTEAIAPLKLDPQMAFSAPNLHDAPLDAIDSRFAGWRQQPDALPAWTAYYLRLEKLTSDGLNDLAVLLDNGQMRPDEAADQFALAYFQALLRDAFRQFPELAAFDGMSHEQVLEKFKELDLERLTLARQEVLLAHRQGMPPRTAAAGEMGVINRELNKKRNHLPIRRLLKEAGHAVQAIKPVFMMSPISVAQYLEPGELSFDLLLIDEASQVEPVDALGAVARVNQTVVVGDDRQLPPTQFFSKIMSDDAPSDEDDAAPTADIESILGLCRAQGMWREMLRWHYRSRHHSLIAVSNHEFYDDKLYVIPSPQQVSDWLGLRFNHVADGVFDRGKSATNRVEAARVADAVMEHARQLPHKTLGVGAFSVAQRDAIVDELEIRRRKCPELESFFAADSAEPFFVKNLENVQGDERDVIFISIGYGKDASGYMAMSFGPLNNDGGERRLNVLITRARERCEVFSSIVAGDIDLNRSQARGVQALKAFLRYAQSGEMDVAAKTGRDYESEFERQVARALEGVGYTVHPQVGLAGFFIDLAVVDPANPARYLLGIECDGQSYHHARWARDRDRLRQQVLEDRGWKIHRIWSTDWFKQPQDQLRRVVEAIEKAKVGVPKTDSLKRGIVHPPENTEVKAMAPGRAASADSADQSVDHSLAKPYVEASFKVNAKRGIHELTAQELAAVIAGIVQVEGPIHEDEIARRTASLWGVKRAGSRITDAVENAIAHAVQVGIIEQAGPFCSLPNQAPQVRDRSNVSSPNLLKPECLPPSEIRAAACQLVKVNFGMSPEEAVGEIARVLGFRRLNAALRQVIENEIHLMVAEHILSSRSGRLFTEMARTGFKTGGVAPRG